MSTRAAWLEARRQGIGGSDAATLFGANPYSSPLKLWGEKTGRVAPTEDNQRNRWGRRFESGVLAEFEFVTGLRVEDQATAAPELIADFEVNFEVDGKATPMIETVKMLRHPSLEIMVGNVDGLVFGAPDGRGVVDAKTSLAWVFNRWDFDDDHRRRPPLYQLVQLRHYMEIVGAKWACIAAFTGLEAPLYIYEIAHDPAFAERLLEVEDDFWRRFVVRDQPPPPDRSEATAKALREIYPKDMGGVVELTGPAIGWARRYDELGVEASALKKEREGLRTLLTATIADKTIGRLPDGSGYTYTGKKTRTLRRATASSINRKTKS